MTKEKTARYAILHFLVDFCCALCIYGLTAGKADFYRCFLVYNFCAFALQMPAGLLADRFGKSEKAAYAGCMLTAVAGLFSMVIVNGNRSGTVFVICVYLLVILTGIGNCLFHVGAGKEVLDESGERLSPLGIFVAPGAVGIFLGPIFAGGNKIFPAGIYGFLLFAGLYFLMRGDRCCSEKERKAKPATGNRIPMAVNCKIIMAVICLFFVVVLRSYMGFVSGFSFQQLKIGGILSLVAVVFGKVAGGLFSDRIGTGKTIMLSMCAAIGGFLLAKYPLFALIGVFFFHMSMPITLYLAAKILKGYKGFAFGLLTFAIFIGFLPVYFGLGQGGKYLPVVVSAVSLMLLCLGLYLGKKGGSE